MTAMDLIDRAKSERAARGLHLRFIGDDGKPFNYYAKDEARKREFIEYHETRGRVVEVVEG